MEPDLPDQLLSSPVLQPAGRDAVKALAARGNVRDYRKDSYLFHQGDEAESIFFLVDGRLEVSSPSPQGARKLHTHLEPPQLFGELGVIGGMTRTATVEAVEDARVWVVGADDFRDFLLDNPPAALGLLRALARQFQEHEVLIDDLLFLDLRGRVAKRLLDLVDPRASDPHRTVTRALTQTDLASLAGGTRENVTRILSDLQRRKILIREGHRYVLTDRTHLEKLATA